MPAGMNFALLTTFQSIFSKTPSSQPRTSSGASTMTASQVTSLAFTIE